jgi:hypothetical protein
LRTGNQHCQKGTPEFLKETLSYARKITKKPLLVRLDAGNDDSENMRICRKNRVDYVIKRNLRGESADEWLEIAQAHGEWRHPREGSKTVYVGSTHRDCNGRAERVVFHVTERMIDRKGQLLLVPEIEVATHWTSIGLRTASADEVIHLCRGHGTCEQFHSELKSDMALERLPSRKFDTNGLLLTLAVPVFNILRISGQNAMMHGYHCRKGTARRRIRTVIQDLMYMAARIITHARRKVIALSHRNPLRGIWADTYSLFAYS